MSLGLENGTVRVVPYDSTWPGLFALESDRLHQKFARAGLPVLIEHTGSTAVFGLTAKPILDILAGYPQGADVAAYIGVLTGSDYVHRGQQDIPGREFFRRGTPRAYHVHLAAIDGAFWRDHITFRDRLRADNALRDAYASLKLDLAARYPHDREAYIAAKAPFVNVVLASSVSSSAKSDTRGR